MSATYYCAKCGKPKQREALQPSTDARDRFRVGICDCSPGNKKGSRPLMTFALIPPPKRIRLIHANGGTQWCKECKDGGSECTNPRASEVGNYCVCSHLLAVA